MSLRRLRPTARISYAEHEEPAMDEYVFCMRCRDYVYEYCAIHGPLLIVPDDKVPAKSPYPPIVPRAALTIPGEFLHLAPSIIPGAGVGVFATLTLPSGVRFGPYRGKKTTEITSYYCWQIYDRDNKCSHVVDAGDANDSNWMRYVNCSRHWCEQNLVAYQYRGELYYRTIKIIPRFTELMVFYGAQFAHSLHVDLRAYNSPARYRQVLEEAERRRLLMGIGTPRVVTTSKDLTSKENAAEDKKTDQIDDLKKEQDKSLVNKANKPKKYVPPMKKTKNSNDDNVDVNLIIEVRNNYTDTIEPAVKKQKHSQHTVSNIENIEKNKTKKIKKLNETNIDINSNIEVKNNYTYITEPAVKEVSSNSTETNQPAVKKQNHTKHTVSNIGNIERNKIKKTKISNETNIDVNSNIEVKNNSADITEPAVKKQKPTKHTLSKIGNISKNKTKKTKKLNETNKHINSNTEINNNSGDITEPAVKKQKYTKHTASNIGNIHVTKQNIQVNEMLLQNDLLCEICDYKCQSKTILEKHLILHTLVKNVFKCNECGYMTQIKHSLILHSKTHTGEKPFSCQFCDYKCAKSGHMKTHERIHTGEKPFSCKFCDYKCAISSAMKTHERTHTGEKPFSCKFCDYKCAISSDMKRHERTHTGEKPFSCKFCDYKCAISSDMKRHERTHTGEKPFSCKFCDYKCAESGKMKIHERTHTGEKPYSCKFCDYKCAESGKMKIHERTHTGEKPFHCKFCDYKCAQSCNMKTHERTHTGEKPYSCKICDFKSAHNDTLKTHIKTKHSG